jgi:hypothetical protein
VLCSGWRCSGLGRFRVGCLLGSFGEESEGVPTRVSGRDRRGAVVFLTSGGGATLRRPALRGDPTRISGGLSSSPAGWYVGLVSCMHSGLFSGLLLGLGSESLGATLFMNGRWQLVADRWGRRSVGG